MAICSACQREIPDKAEFCMYCGFRVEPIAAQKHLSLSSKYRTLTPEELQPPPEKVKPSLPEGEQRSFERFPIKVEVDYESDHNFYTGFLENISEGGLFIATHTPMEIGKRLEVTFSVPGLSRNCVALCEVRWIRPFNALNPEFPPGVGCAFFDLDAEARAAIDLFIQHRQPIFFE